MVAEGVRGGKGGGGFPEREGCELMVGGATNSLTCCDGPYDHISPSSLHVYRIRYTRAASQKVGVDLPTDVAACN